MKMQTLAIAVAAILALVAPEQATTGAIAGCISDAAEQRVPGTTVFAKGGGLERTTRSDPSGCYEIRDLPAASYRVTATFDGFSNITRNKVPVAPSTVSRLDFTMRVAPLCDCIQGGPQTLAEHLAYADAVLYLRISDDEPDGSDDYGVYPHRATVIAAAKTPAVRVPSRIVVNQNFLPLFNVGQEMIAFVKFVGPEATPKQAYPALLLLVENGRIVQAPGRRVTPVDFSRYEGMTAEAVLKELRAALRRKR